MVPRVRTILLGLALCAPAGLAGAADFVVVKSEGADLAVGQAVDGATPLTLKSGQRVVLIGATGQTIRLRGPWDKAPATDAATAPAPDAATALKALLTRSLARSENTAAVRAASPQVMPPEPWLLDVSHDGDRCLPENSPVIFWRPGGAGADAALSLSPSDRAWEVRIAWPEGTDRLRLPPTLIPRTAFFNHASYLVAQDGKTARITLVAIPRAASTDAMRAAWMIEEGCHAQAQALLRLALRQSAH